MTRRCPLPPSTPTRRRPLSPTQGRVPYQDVSGHDFTALLLGNDSSRTYEYVMVPNTGDTADYQGLDVTGKIAVVMRGGLSFEQKQLNAASAGAAGCIIYTTATAIC